MRRIVAHEGVQQAALQWVHGSRTVVNPTKRAVAAHSQKLQWVHGSRTVVNWCNAADTILSTLLQWVHGSRTVVNRASPADGPRMIYAASMGPRFENRG